MSELPGLDPFDPVQADKAEAEDYNQLIDTDAQLRQFIERRKSAYSAVFGGKDDPNVQFVMEDLAYFCKAFHPPFDPDPRKQDVKIGRMDVFFRIFEHTRLSVDTLYLRYTDALTKLQQNGNPNG